MRVCACGAGFVLVAVMASDKKVRAVCRLGSTPACLPGADARPSTRTRLQSAVLRCLGVIVCVRGCVRDVVQTGTGDGLPEVEILMRGLLSQPGVEGFMVYNDAGTLHLCRCLHVLRVDSLYTAWVCGGVA
ncbi:hypothetical protein EON67_12170, partial [archaeon]